MKLTVACYTPATSDRADPNATRTKKKQTREALQELTTNRSVEHKNRHLTLIYPMMENVQPFIGPW